MNQKSSTPSGIDWTPEETLEKFAQVDPDEFKPAQPDQVRLVEGDTGHRVLIYATGQGMNVELRYDNDTFWASQNQMAEMFGVDRTSINKHLQNIYAEGELVKEATCEEVSQVRNEGGRQVARKHLTYDLNVIISVGYRVNSIQGTMFRIWATDKLFRILTRGFYIDKERLKNPERDNIVQEFREIAREIRTSTQNMYREVKRLCTLCQDYDGSGQEAREFFMCMENKLLYASAGMTAPEIILQRADASQPDMGLTSYTGARGPTRADIKIANNYLAEGEARIKNRITDLWLTYIEDQLDQGKLVTMSEVREKLDGFVIFNEWPLLKNQGKVTRKTADAHATSQHELYIKLLGQS